MLLQGDACHIPLKDKSVDCCVTSPPYYNLRRYVGVEPTQWPPGTYVPVPGAEPCTVPAWSGCLGNEEAPISYVWHLLLVLRDVRRTLKDTGVCWLIIADSYATNPGNGRGGETVEGGIPHRSAADKTGAGYPQGSLLGIPQQVMLAAMADGWVCRNDVVWSKNSPMPESILGWRWQQARCRCVSHTRGGESYRNGSMPTKPQSDHDPAHPKDFAPAQPDPACPTCGGTGRLATEVLRKGSWRHTRATETILMLTKGMQYFANGEAVREPSSDDMQRRALRGHTRGAHGKLDASRCDHETLRGAHAQVITATGRNPRNVMMPAPSPLGHAHYAAFPPGLIEPLIRATCPERCCPTCGMGWAPMTTQLRASSWEARKATGHISNIGGSVKLQKAHGATHHFDNRAGGFGTPAVYHTTGLRPSCPHYCTCDPLAPEPGLLVQDRTCPRCAKLLHSLWTPGLVCDPFVGSGTTLAVARALSRHGIGVDRSWPYLSAIARSRLGLADLAAWEGAPASPPPITYSDLPLFRASN
jgi:DNA modification methylase